MQDMLGDEYPAFIKSYDNPFRNGIRINPLKITADRFAQEYAPELKGVPWNPNGFYIDDKRSFSTSPLYHAGLYYIQEASAMLPAFLANVKPGERVLDLCAAPGGKSTAVGAALQGKGLLVSNDISRTRAKALLHNIEVFGIKNAAVISEYPDKLTAHFPGFFDKILIDAPCSGEGMFHKEPSMTQAWEMKGPEEYHKIQMDILRAAAVMLRPGGRIIYSTCTFSPLEDEGSLSWFLNTYPEFCICDMRTELSPYLDLIAPGKPEWIGLDQDHPLKLAFRIWPHKVSGEGHFAAVLEKSASDHLSAVAGKDSKSRSEDPAPFYEFLKKEQIQIEIDPERLIVSKGYVRYVPDELPALPGVHILRSGWFLGEMKKGRFEPSTAFARGLLPEQCRKSISFDAAGPDIVRYLKCETLSVDPSLPSGWYLICADQYPMGWAKIAGGTLKNKYPAGWRLMS